MRFALIGYGYWGRIVARAIARTGELAVIIEGDGRKRAEATADWGAWGTAVDEHLEEWATGVDAVWVCTPTVDHLPTVTTALHYHLHALCEKPFVLTSDGAEHLVNLARENDRALMVGHLTLHTARHDHVYELPQRPNRICAIRRNTEASLSDGSVLAGIGPHEIAPLLDLLGEPDTLSCTGTMHRVVFELGWEIRPSKPAIGLPAVLATVELDWLAEERYRYLEVDGQPVNQEDKVEPLIREAQTFIRACAGEGRERWYEDALSVTRVLEKLEIARTWPSGGS